MPRNKLKVGDFVCRCESNIRLNDSSRDGIVTRLFDENQVEVKWNSNDIGHSIVAVREKKKI